MFAAIYITLNPTAHYQHLLFRRAPTTTSTLGSKHKTCTKCGFGSLSCLSSILGELKVNLWDHIGIIVPQKRLPTLLLSYDKLSSSRLLSRGAGPGETLRFGPRVQGLSDLGFRV